MKNQNRLRAFIESLLLSAILPLFVFFSLFLTGRTQEMTNTEIAILLGWFFLGSLMTTEIVENSISRLFQRLTSTRLRRVTVILFFVSVISLPQYFILNRSLTDVLILEAFLFLLAYAFFFTVPSFLDSHGELISKRVNMAINQNKILKLMAYLFVFASIIYMLVNIKLF